ncbi:hypothetical protein FZC79_00130 [Rossellomorea vietnamensis]|uniref:Uncharacterized protein n=1 Tax=Rossellomorea vietnamensis TaxID=218284 RepID=A0A5D4KJ10_9BACI|nr:hypothetical protein [Rossellomorea vietnamensis]TYR77271.1 hypothetical protein FZC79_00130 [Rossellomorea vietnamensis]
MNKVIVKSCVFIVLAVILGIMLMYEIKKGEELKKDKVTLTEKYFAPGQSNVAVGIKTNKTIEIRDSGEKHCAMEFSNKKIFEVDCDKYLDFTIGDKVIIIYKDNRLIKLGKK